MYQFSDSDSVDSDEGIRYKTESIRNKKSAEKNSRNEKGRHSRRERDRSRSRSRSRHHADRKKLKRRTKDYSPEDKSNRRSSKSKRRENDRLDDKKHRKEKVKSKKDGTVKEESVLRSPEESSCEKRSSTTAVVECGTFGPSLPRKPDLQVKEKSTDPPDSVQDLPLGPTLPPKANTPTPSISGEEGQSENGNTFGPQLPPGLVKKPGGEDNLIGPVLPPHFITVSSLDDDTSTDTDSLNVKEVSTQNNIIGPALPPDVFQKSEENVVGPALPPEFQQESVVSKDDENEDEEVYGPVPAGAHYSQAHIELEERALKMKMDQLDSSEDAQPVREEWMLTLPEAKAATFGLGPRQFRRKAGPDLSDRSSWTDTPEDKVKKKEGKAEPVLDLKKEAEQKHIHNRNVEQEKISKEHKKGKDSLLEIHRKKLKKEKNDSGPSERRPFSREIDLQVNRFDDAQKQAVLKKAQLLDNRFSSGESKFL